jgi:hypothetical protein
MQYLLQLAPSILRVCQRPSACSQCPAAPAFCKLLESVYLYRGRSFSLPTYGSMQHSRPAIQHTGVLARVLATHWWAPHDGHNLCEFTVQVDRQVHQQRELAGAHYTWVVTHRCYRWSLTRCANTPVDSPS